MALNYLWLFFFLAAFVTALARLIFLGDTEVFTRIVASTFDMAKASVDIAIYLIGIMTLWLGFMKVGENGGAIRVLSRQVAPLFRRLFPELPRDDPASGAMLMNICANLLGLDNAATPLGLKAMEALQARNPNKDQASNAQIMLLVLNTSGLTLLPISILAIRAAEGAANPADIFLPILLATFFSTLAGLIAVSVVQRLRLWDPVLLAYLGGATCFIGAVLFGFSRMPPEQISAVSTLIANFLLFGVIISFLTLGMCRGINVYESFIDGAKEGFHMAVRIIPFLVAMLVAIGVFRASGLLDLLVHWLTVAFDATLGRSEFAEALPTALMKPLSGARAMMIETMQTHGPDSFVGRLSCVFQGSTETTFYMLAVYFGSVGIRKTRHAVACGLIADAAGIVAAIGIAYLFFN